MSIEERIDALRESIEKLTASVNALTARYSEAGPEPVAEKPKAEKPKAKAKAKPEPKAEAEAKPEPKAEKPKEITLTELAKDFTKMMGDKGRDAGVALLAEYNAAKLTAIPKDKWPEVHGKIQQALGS
jgi:hypothetical protein